MGVKPPIRAAVDGRAQGSDQPRRTGALHRFLLRWHDRVLGGRQQAGESL